MAASKTKKKILIVDDDPQILELYSALLQEAGYHVDRAENALAAIAAVVVRAPDLILADIRMPIVDGVGLVRELKNHSDSRHIPVVAVTGYDSPGSREAALQAGYDGYFAKPIDARRFPEQIAGFLRQHKPKERPQAQN
ncbi:MAG: response regulator [Verrucomicrobia bacterium]|nr:MAG: response regulator [Verrucomicrobiota bacterium]